MIKNLLFKRFVAVLLFAAFIIYISPGPIRVLADDDPFEYTADISIIFTHDLHAHFEPSLFVDDNGLISERGGYSRMKTAIGQIQANYPQSFILDAGDFSMGTLYQTIFSEYAPDLRVMGLMGFHATTLGNHEFDYRAQGLTDMLYSALASDEYMPAVLIANIDWEKTLADEKLEPDARELRMAMNRFGLAENFIVIEQNGIRAAVFGLIGNEADTYAPESGLFFSNYIEAAKRIVSQIRARGDIDMIICLSHSGTDHNPRRSEDELLAAAVPEIDVIISGHSHTRLAEPIVVGNTFIVSVGAYSYDLGHITLNRGVSRFVLADYELVPINQNLRRSAEIDTVIARFKGLVEDSYLSMFGYGFDEVLAYSPFGFTPIEQFGKQQGEDPLGNLISDSYIDAVMKAEGNNYRTVDVAIVPNGVIRGSFTPGDITVADAFQVSSLGIGPDRVPGYPLVNIYLTGKELKTIAEIDISVSNIMSAARLYVSGLQYTYNPNRLILNRVTDVKLMRPNGNLEEIVDERLYRVIGGLYSCQMMGAVESQSFGLLKVEPKDMYGNPITDFEDHIIYDGGMELKEWLALANYIASFEPVGGVPQVPEFYNMLHGRKISEPSWSPIELFKNPNKIFYMALGAVLVALAIIITPICMIIRKRKRKKRVSRKRFS